MQNAQKENRSLDRFPKVCHFTTDPRARNSESALHHTLTERAVFKLIDKKMTLIEIAPGLDLQRDVLDQMGFVPAISENLKEMDPRIFRDGLMGLAQ